MLGWLDSAIRRRKRAWDDVTASQILAVLRCCVWLLAEMTASRALFDLNNHKYGVKRHLRFCEFPKNSECAVCGCVLLIKQLDPQTAHFQVKIRTSTRHISEFFENGKISWCLFIPDLRLFKSNTARDECIIISANSQTQHWRTTNIWLAVMSSHALFLCRIAESSQPSIIL